MNVVFFPCFSSDEVLKLLFAGPVLCADVSVCLCLYERDSLARKRKMNILFHTHIHKMQWTLWHEKRVTKRFSSGVAFECVELKYVMVFIIFVQVFSIQLITKQSEMLPDFFPSFASLRHFPFHHMHPKNTDMWTMCHRQNMNEKKMLFLLFWTHIVRIFFWTGNNPGLLTFQYVPYSGWTGFDIFRLLLLFVSPLFQSSYLFFFSCSCCNVVDIFSLVLCNFFFFWFVICLNGCFNAVISCFITDKILHLTLTNNMPLRCRCSPSLHSAHPSALTQSTTKLNGQK